jgi:hypothetical protein
LGKLETQVRKKFTAYLIFQLAIVSASRQNPDCSVATFLATRTCSNHENSIFRIGKWHIEENWRDVPTISPVHTPLPERTYREEQLL